MIFENSYVIKGLMTQNHCSILQMCVYGGGGGIKHLYSHTKRKMQAINLWIFLFPHLSLKITVTGNWWFGAYSGLARTPWKDLLTSWLRPGLLSKLPHRQQWPLAPLGLA